MLLLCTRSELDISQFNGLVRPDGMISIARGHGDCDVASLIRAKELLPGTSTAF